MRISQLRSLDQNELDMLLYIVNVVDPVKPALQITPELLLSFNIDSLTYKLTKQESKLNDEGKFVFKSLMLKLNRNPLQDVIDDMTPAEFSQLEIPFMYDNTTKPILTQSILSF